MLGLPGPHIPAPVCTLLQARIFLERWSTALFRTLNQLGHLKAV